MRIARVFEGSSPTVALAHGSGLYRASAIEAILGTPLPDGTSQAFEDRVFALGLLGLDLTHAELAGGTHLEDTRLPPNVALLPPVGKDPAVLELPAFGSDTRPRRVSGRALCGHEGSVALPFAAPQDTRARSRDRGGQSAAPGMGVGVGLAFVLGEDLRRATPAGAWNAVIGASLSLTFSLGELDERAGFVPAQIHSRELGTALGPWLVTRDEWGSQVTLSTPDGDHVVNVDGARIGNALSWVSWLGDVRAGDVLIVATPPAWRQLEQRVSVEAPGFGQLAVTLGGAPGIPGDGLARIDDG